MCKQIVVPILLALLLCASVSAQENLNQYKVDCSKFGPGCSSYNRIVEKKSELIARAGKSHAFVCFRNGENVFIILNHQEPDDGRFVQTRTPGGNSQSGMITYRRFKNGALDESRSFYGSWIKSDSAADKSHAEFVPSTKGSAILNDDYLSLAYDLPKQENGMRYFMLVRRSTLEFSEGHNRPSDLIKEAGACVEFKPGP